MKPVKKRKYPVEKEAVGHRKRNRPERLWRLEFQWKSLEHWQNSKLWFRGKDYHDRWEYRWHKYIDLDHAMQQISKNLRTRFSFIKREYDDMNIRLRNIKTNETRHVIIAFDRIWIESHDKI